LPTYFLVAQILIAAGLVTTILLQLHGGGIGGIFGQADSVYRTRRGLQKTMLRLTIILTIIFVIFSFLIVLVQ